MISTIIIMPHSTAANTLAIVPASSVEGAKAETALPAQSSSTLIITDISLGAFLQFMVVLYNTGLFFVNPWDKINAFRNRNASLSAEARMIIFLSYAMTRARGRT